MLGYLQRGILTADIRHGCYMGGNKTFEADESVKHILNEKKRHKYK